MIRKTTITASGAALLGATFLVVACSDSPEDNGGDNGGGGTGPNGGVSGTGQGGTGPATGGTGVTGGTPGTGGTGVTGGTPGTGGAGGAGTGGGGGAAAMGPFSCAMPNTVNCGSIGDFPTGSAQTFGDGTFSGGISVFGAGISRDMNDTTKLHITGMVTGYGHGFNIWMTACSTFAAYDGIAFTISGTTGDTPMNTIDFQLQSNTDYPWQPRVADAKGACTAPGTQDPYGYCIAPTLNVMLSPTATPASQTVTWAMMMGGMPTPWSATTMPAELVGIQWQFPWTPTKTAYAVDVTLDDVKFSGGSGPTTACPAYMPGGGGMGGAGGAGGGAGAGGAGGGAAGGGAGGAAGGAGKAGGGGMAGGAGQAGGGAGGAASGAGGMAGRAGGGMGGT